MSFVLDVLLSGVKGVPVVAVAVLPLLTEVSITRVTVVPAVWLSGVTGLPGVTVAVLPLLSECSVTRVTVVPDV